MVTHTKLDTYDYSVVRVGKDLYDIQIKVDSSTDVTIADIATEITASEGRIYVEGNYYTLKQMTVEPTLLHIYAWGQ